MKLPNGSPKEPKKRILEDDTERESKRTKGVIKLDALEISPEHRLSCRGLASYLLWLTESPTAIKLRKRDITISPTSLPLETLRKLTLRKWSVESILNELRTNAKLRESLKLIGGGTTATVRCLCTNDDLELAVKITKGSAYVGSIYDGAAVEPRLLEYFTKRFLLTGLSPHFPVFVGHAFSAARGQDITITEKAKYGSLDKYFASLKHSRETLLLHARMILFQVVYTFAKLQKLHPNFRHNDLKIDNVLVGEGAAVGQSCYYDGDVTFYQANLGFRAIVNDFDQATILGLADNLQAIEWAMNDPTMGMGPNCDLGVDLYYFACNLNFYIRKSLPSFGQSTLAEDMMGVWDQHVLCPKIYDKAPMFRVPPNTTTPSAVEVLHSTLFEEFRRPVNNSEVLQCFGLYEEAEGTESIAILTSLPALDEENYTVDGILNVEVGFGTTNRECSLFSLPAVAAYEAARGGVESKFAHHEFVCPDEALFTPSLNIASDWINDMMEEEESEDLRATVIAHALDRMTQIVRYLGRVRKCYIPLIAGLAAIEASAEARRVIGRGNCIHSLATYSGGGYSYNDVEAGLLQYRWICLAMESEQS